MLRVEDTLKEKDEIKINDYLRGQVSNYIYQVKAGSKPIAVESVQTRYIDEAVDMIKKEQLYIHVEDVEGYPEWKTIFIYKYKYLIDIIKNLPRAPRTPYDHWVLGKAFGYSEHAIEEFVKSKNVEQV